MARKAKADDEVDARGQMTVPLDGQEYVLRPSLEAILAIERQTRPRTLYDLATEASQIRLPIEDLATIVAHFMRAHGKASPDDPLATDYQGAKPERLRDLIYEAGIPSITQRVYVVLLGAISGGYDASGEVKAPTITKATPVGA